MTLYIGDVCRAGCGAPARYSGNGTCLFISCQDNDLCMDLALPPTGGEEKFPLPLDSEIKAFIFGYDGGNMDRLIAAFKLGNRSWKDSLL